jgi:ketosteroid isomerase-like protein
MTQFDKTSDKIYEVIRAERAWLDAHLRLDISLMDSLMADEYTQVNSQGELVGKEKVLASFRAEKRYWQEAESDEYQIQIYGSVAVVHGRWRAKGINSGKAFNYAARYVSVWVERNRRWQMVSDQSTEIPNISEP